ncbi:conserved exported hypothetical protein [Nitrospira lenta]|uniref:Uncharacterized protein n=2 Tax=Nitrospira lenta TaxID=1436998 RepID=A0A330L8Z9_9BACT|nr:conserved exported hypothetical protein [Nitrospira lenta]
MARIFRVLREQPLGSLGVLMMFRSLHSHALLRRCLSLALLAILLGLAPFAVAQDVHHELAAADHDGHEHSDTDLCQWVQHHTAGSLDDGAPILVAGELVRLVELPAESILLSVEPSSFDPSRAPPRR